MMMSFFNKVTDFVRSYNEEDEIGNFLEHCFPTEEVSKANYTLHINKAPGFDEVTSEHLHYAGPIMTEFLCDLFNSIRDTYLFQTRCPSASTQRQR